jgi:hypothetical protein
VVGSSSSLGGFYVMRHGERRVSGYERLAMKRYKLKAKQKSNQRKRARNLLEYKTIRLFLPKTKFFLGP